MKAREMPRVYVLRGLITAAKNLKVERRGAALAEADLVQLVRRGIRKRGGAEEFAAKAGPRELGEPNPAQRAPLQAYVPAPLPPPPLEGRVRELSMYNISSIPRDVVAYGSRVTVEDDAGESTAYDIVFPEEVDAAKGQISLSSPLGRALLNKAVGDEVEVQTPSGKRTYQIVELVTLHELQGHDR